jgi:hypothetical protein
LAAGQLCPVALLIRHGLLQLLARCRFRGDKALLTAFLECGAFDVGSGAIDSALGISAESSGVQTT